MLSDEERIELIVGDDADVDDAARADAAMLAAALADPVTWAEPPAALEGRVVEHVRSEASHGQPVASRARPGRPTHIRRLVPLVGVAAAAVVALGAVLALRDTGDESPVALASLQSDTDPSASGSVRIFDADSGFAVYLELEGLPRLADDGFYEAWVRDEAGTLVSLGTFSESAGPITLWSGVDPCRFGTITITRERPDGDPGSSGDRVVAGPVDCAS
jgi:anti-sigma-K factor RskA